MVNNVFNKKLAEFFDKMDDKMLKIKLNSAIDMLKKGNTEELAKKISKIDKDELLEKINDFDISRLNELNIDVEEIKKNINTEDLEKLKNLVGEHGEEIIGKLKNMLE